jgi:hypothetical protein
LQEVFRVLKTGGQLEVRNLADAVAIADPPSQITEEQQIFPCGPQFSDSLPLPTDSAVSLSSNFLTTPTASTEAISPISPTNEKLLPAKKTSSHDSDFYSQTPRISLEYGIDPRDHRRLAASWKAMLQTRFLSPQPLPILNFYLSSIFGKLEHLPQLQFRLPPNSNLLKYPPWDDRSCSNSSFDHESAITFSPQPTPPPKKVVWGADTDTFVSHSPLPNSSSAVQLARRLNIIAGCKEAIWEAYETLYGDCLGVSKVHGRARSTARDEFELHWSNWIK